MSNKITYFLIFQIWDLFYGSHRSRGLLFPPNNGVIFQTYEETFQRVEIGVMLFHLHSPPKETQHLVKGPSEPRI